MNKRQTKSGVQERVRHMLVVERLCSRFHLIAQQLPSRFRVENERDVQDLLRALLVLEHDDIRPQTWTPGYAEGNARTDFLLRLEQIVLEARLAQDRLDAAMLNEQLAIDIRQHAQQPDCKTLVCFIYDPAGRVANPRAIEHELSGERDGLTVRVIIAPH